LGNRSDPSSGCPLPQQQLNTIALAERVLRDAKSGELVSLVAVGETIDGAYSHGYTSASQDRFGRFGYLLFTALKVVGFENEMDNLNGFDGPNELMGEED
jgi:hypothetical protein